MTGWRSRALAHYLAWMTACRLGTWPNLGESPAGQSGRPRHATAAPIKARERWSRTLPSPSCASSSTPAAQPGPVMSAHESRHGSVSHLRRGCGSAGGRRGSGCARSPGRCDEAGRSVEAESYDQPRCRAVWTISPVGLIASARPGPTTFRQLGAAQQTPAPCRSLCPATVLRNAGGVPPLHWPPGAPTAALTSPGCCRCLEVAQGGVVQPPGDLPPRHGAAAGIAPVPGALIGARRNCGLREIQDRVRSLSRGRSLAGCPELDRLSKTGGR